MAQRKNEAKWIESRERWQINVQADGERRTFTSSIPFMPDKKSQPGKIEAEKKADKWLDERLVDENIRVEKMLDKFSEKLHRATSKSHYHQQDGYINNWIKPVIGTKRVKNLTVNDLQSVIDIAYEKGYCAAKKTQKDKKLSKKTLMNLRSCISAFLKFCRQSNVTKLHLEDALTIPKQARVSIKTIADPSEIQTLFAISTTTYFGKLVEDRHIHAYRFSFLTGIRPGELLGLLNKNVNGSKITITQSINIYGDITCGKNDNARRTYTLDYHAAKVLEDQREMLCRIGQISPYVFPAADGDFIKEEIFRRAWKRYCKANGIENATTPYEMRHTFVSVNKEMPDAFKKMIVGHSKDMDTDGTYGHEMQGDMARAADYVGEAYKRILGW